ncbi:response regulator [Cereibacter sp. SYSU M97828]|nr:response regulator [Cereibacter flavus]
MPSHVILVVEDEPLLRLDAMTILEEAGHTVIGASNSASAIDILESRPDITAIFTDIDMGAGHDGLWLAARVRDRWPPVLIIVTSGHRRVTAEMLPSDAPFMAKPYTENQLLDQFARLAA